MTKPKRFATLSDLRPFYGQVVPFANEQNGFYRIALNRQRKFYGSNAPNRRWFYTPEVLKAYGEMKSIKKIALMFNAQSLDEIREQYDKAMEQLLYRAIASPEDSRRAAELLFRLVKAGVKAIEKIVECKPDTMRPIARRYPEWPVLLNQSAILQRKKIKEISQLQVGIDSLAPTKSRQRVDLINHWTALAEKAANICDHNRHIVPVFLRFAMGGHVSHNFKSFFEKRINIKFYEVENEVIGITDWQEQCASLTVPITEPNFDQWWKAVYGCVTEYWLDYEQEYKSALREIHNTHKTDAERRNLATTRLKQAFRSLVGLRSKTR